jgi:SAM-dependent methyltransferase
VPSTSPSAPAPLAASSLATRARARLRRLRWQAAGHERKLPRRFIEPLRGAAALEVGGPSQVFSADGLLPVYPELGSIDGVQWAAETTWHNLDATAGYSPEGEARGSLLLVDDVELPEIGDATYGAVMSSHVIEHIANPLRALAAWRRVTRPGGHLLIVVPHKEGTFDRRRPTTALEHLVEDLERGTAEDDLTHLQETLDLHDHERDIEPRTSEWEQRRRENPSTRLLHHHTFTTGSVLRMLDRAGLRLLEVETRFPHDIYVLGAWPERDEPVDNERFITARRRSPFRADREAFRDRGSSEV